MIRKCLVLLILAIGVTACSKGSHSDGDSYNPYCPEGQTCQACDSTGDCPIGMYCEPQGHVCLSYPLDGDVEAGGCRSTSDCANGKTCVDGVCLISGDGDMDAESAEADLDLDDKESADLEDETGEEGDGAVRCDDYLPCTDDIPDGHGGCFNPLRSGWCRIDGNCVAAHSARPGNICQECNPSLDSQGWSNLTTGTACDDGLVCTTGDACRQGVCTGTARVCEDGVACTVDSCKEPSGCENSPNDSLCQAYEFCDVAQGCKAGGCLPNAVRCVGAAREVCDAYGAWQPDVTCADPTPLCTEAGCRACQPGQKRCSGATLQTCSAQGLWTDELCLGPAPSCVDGACVACTDGATSCQETAPGVWSVLSCSGQTWQIVLACAEPKPTCTDLQDGQGARCLECRPGDTRCDGLSHQICDANGIWQVAPCPAGTPVCEAGLCQLCLLGDLRCGETAKGESANSLYRCAAGAGNVNAWQLDHACPAEAPNCKDGVCEACTPGAARCGLPPYGRLVCNLDGLWVADTPCAEPTHCNPANAQCESGSSLYFDGHSRMLIPDQNDYDPNAEFTLEAWVYPTGLSGDCNTAGNTIMEKWDTWPKGTYMLAACAHHVSLNRDNMVRFFARVDGPQGNSDDYLNSRANAIALNTWTHIAVVWSNSYLDLYINGLRDVHKSNLLGWRTPNTFNQDYLSIGMKNDQASWGFLGYIDEVRISKIARYTTASFTPSIYFANDAFTMGLWHFDSLADPQVCLDSSGHHNGQNTYGATYSEMGVGETPARR